MKSPYVPEAGIRVLEYDASLPLDKILRNEQENIAVAVGDVIGGDETGKEKFLVGKPVAKDGKSYLPMIYAGFTSENEGQVDETVRYLVECKFLHKSIHIRFLRFTLRYQRFIQNFFFTALTLI